MIKGKNHLVQILFETRRNYTKSYKKKKQMNELCNSPLIAGKKLTEVQIVIRFDRTEAIHRCF